MAQQSPLHTMSPDEYAERVLQHRQRVEAAAADPGYLMGDSPQEWVIGMVLGFTDQPVTKPPLRQRFFAGVDRFLARYDTTFRED